MAWLSARQGPSGGSNGRFLLRYEDLDSAAVRDEHYRSQAEDLTAVGLDWDDPVIRQSERLERYREAVSRLQADDLVYPCFCSRREIREAASAPNRPHAGHHYPGTCRDLSTARRAERALTRPPAHRVRAAGNSWAFDDLVLGHCDFELDDFVIGRNDGTPAYHLVVVVDDAAEDVDLVVRADDLAESTSRHLFLYELLGLRPPRHAHVPLVLAPDGNRLAKRHGAVNLSDREARGETPAEVMRYLASTLGLCRPDEEIDRRPIQPAELIDRLDFTTLPSDPLHLSPEYLEPPGDSPGI